VALILGTIVIQPMPPTQVGLIVPGTSAMVYELQNNGNVGVTSVTIATSSFSTIAGKTLLLLIMSIDFNRSFLLVIEDLSISCPLDWTCTTPTGPFVYNKMLLPNQKVSLALNLTIAQSTCVVPTIQTIDWSATYQEMCYDSYFEVPGGSSSTAVTVSPSFVLPQFDVMPTIPISLLVIKMFADQIPPNRSASLMIREEETSSPPSGTPSCIRFK